MSRFRRMAVVFIANIEEALIIIIIDGIDTNLNVGIEAY